MLLKSLLTQSLSKLIVQPALRIVRRAGSNCTNLGLPTNYGGVT